MNVINNFPLLRFKDSNLRVVESEDALTRATSKAVKNGFFRNQLLVTSDGRAQLIERAEIVSGIGSFWGYNIFLNRLVRIKLIASGAPYSISKEEVIKRVLESLGVRSAWATRGDFDELKKKVAAAQTVAEVIELLSVTKSSVL